MSDITLFGIGLSPYVRKVRAVLAYKAVPYRHEPVAPVAGSMPSEFIENSPLGKIPLMRIGDDYLPDSSVMCDWLEQTHPEPALLPADRMARARALWFEEYADGHIVNVFSGHLFAEVVLAPKLFKREPNQSDIDLAVQEEIPAICEYLESQLHGEYLVGDSLSLADIAVGGCFVTLMHTDYQVDATRWPKVAAYAERMVHGDLFAPLVSEERQLLSSLG